MNDKQAWWKFLILAGLVAVSMVFVYPPRQKIRFGLDLKGGTSFTVAIDEDRIREDLSQKSAEETPEDLNRKVQAVLDGAQDRAIEVLRNRIDNLGIAEPIIYPGKDNRIVIQLPGVDEKKRLEAEKSIMSVAFLEFRMVHEKNDELVSRLFDENLAPEGYVLTRVGTRMGYRRDASFPEGKMDAEYKKRLGRFKIPDAGHEFLLEKDEEEGVVFYRPCFVKRRSELKGDMLASARVDYRGLGQPVVLLSFDSKGAVKFKQVTTDFAPGGRENPGQNSFRQLAIVLDGTLYSAPVIREPISGGKAEISGNFSPSEAILLANILKAGSLPAPVKVIEKRSVSPSLGTDSIKSGINASLLGMVGVVLFMLIYYRLSGVVANLALMLNMLILPLGMIVTAGFLGVFSSDGSGQGVIKLPVLTLPGIAGIVLTVGMAVDANVLIFERIREELSSGKRVWAAVTAGFDRAFVTILDSNLTTLLAAVILFVMGSGPIRGFAVTLCAGIIVSMYTALTVTKLIFDLMINRFDLKNIRMMRFVSGTNIDFLGKRAVAIVLSVAVIAGTWIYMGYREKVAAGSIYGVDFTGGAAVTFGFDTRKSVQEVRDVLAAAGITDPHIQYQKEMDGSGVEFLHVKTGAESVNGVSSVEVVKKAVTEGLGDAGYRMLQEDEVGAQVGRELQKKAMIAVIVALVGMIIYITIRFELGFAAGAIVALAHDVLITIGLFSAFGRPFSLTFVAALLTIVGYSINDTIVIFDRVREDLKMSRSMSFKDICNLSINQTLSRTILTSLTTLITVVMLLVFGGGAINDFALALCLGIIAGTYSTVFIATPVVLAWYKGRKPVFAQKGS